MGKVCSHAPQAKQGTIRLMKWGGHPHGPFRLGFTTPTKVLTHHADTNDQTSPSVLAPHFQRPWITLHTRLGTLACTMRVNTPKQSISTFKSTHNVPACHPTMQNTLVIYCYKCFPNSSLYTQPTANRYTCLLCYYRWPSSTLVRHSSHCYLSSLNFFFSFSFCLHCTSTLGLWYPYFQEKATFCSYKAMFLLMVWLLQM